MLLAWRLLTGLFGGLLVFATLQGLWDTQPGSLAFQARRPLASYSQQQRPVVLMIQTQPVLVISILATIVVISVFQIRRGGPKPAQLVGASCVMAVLVFRAFGAEIVEAIPGAVLGLFQGGGLVMLISAIAGPRLPRLALPLPSTRYVVALASLLVLGLVYLALVYGYFPRLRGL